MTSRRATKKRREKQRADDPVPVIPGVIPDLSEASKAQAMREAHEQLPPVKRSTVSVLFLDPAEGINLIAEHFGPAAAETMRGKLADVGGSDPHIVIATRLPRHTQPKESTP